MLIKISVRCNYIFAGVVGMKESGDTNVNLLNCPWECELLEWVLKVVEYYPVKLKTSIFYGSAIPCRNTCHAECY